MNLFRREGIHKVKCSGIAEVAIAAQAGMRYILLAYPVVGPKCSRHVKIVLAYPSAIISCLVDNVDSAKALSAIANENIVTTSVFIEVNVEQGRKEVAPGGFCDLWMACKELKGIRPVGIHTYDGHNHDADLDSRRRIADGIHKMILNLPEEISEKTTVVLGGSPSFPVYATYKDIQVSPGTFVYWDKSYSDNYP